MNISTKYHGIVKVNQGDIWKFQNGIPGFLEEKEFIALPLSDENQFFTILQSVQTPELGFVMTNPFLFFPDYEFELDEASFELLGVKGEKDILIYVFLNVKTTFANTTANLLAPIIFNKNNHLAKQVILRDTIYKTKHKLNLAKG